MHYSQCNLGSTLALGARALEEHLQVMTSMDEKMRAEEVERYRKMAALGASLVDTCHRAAEAEVNFGSADRFTLLPNGSIIHPFSEEDEHFDFRYDFFSIENLWLQSTIFFIISIPNRASVITSWRRPTLCCTD